MSTYCVSDGNITVSFIWDKKRKYSERAGSWVDILSVVEKEQIDEALVEFFYRCNIPFNVIESNAFKDFIKTIRPAYEGLIPTAKQLGGCYLDKCYEKYKDLGKKLLDDAQFYSIVTDGWSNLGCEHIVNYIIIVPDSKPFFYKALDTSGIRQTSERIAQEIINVAEELGPSKLVSVFTDNASNMRGAWEIIESKYPHVFANSCASHVLNLLIGDICELKREILDAARFVVNFVKERGHLLAKFRELQRAFKIKKGLSLPVPTRWYTQFNCIANLLQNKVVLKSLIDTDELEAVVENDKTKNKTKFITLIKDDEFWGNLVILKGDLEYPTSFIGKMERNDSDLSEIYEVFQKLISHYKEKEDDGLLGLVLKRWNFLHTESMGMAFILNPANIEKEMVGNDREDSVTQLLNYISKVYQEEEAIKCRNELVGFISYFRNSGQAAKSKIVDKAKKYWLLYGLTKYPLLANIALKLYSAPISSASSERVWSIFSLAHSRIRNRLKNKKVEKLVYVYCNAALLDEVDTINYLKELDDEDDSDTTAEDDTTMV